MTDLTTIIQGAILLIFGVLSAFVAPWLKAKLGAEKTAELIKLYMHMNLQN